MVRREFMRTAAMAALGARAVLGANDRIGVGLVGTGGRGDSHMDGYSSLPDARIVAVCDVHRAARERAVERVRQLTGTAPKAYADMRELFADASVDAVSFATPNHWHALGTIWACQAGKDVYVEKPASHNIFEGRKMVEAARKYQRIVQVGTQDRSDATYREAIELLHQGVIGKIHTAKGLCYKRRRSIGHKPEEPVPAGLNWDAFLGPAPMRAFTQNRFHYNWHWFWETGNGDIGNQGVHEMDLAVWGLAQTAVPSRVVSTGGKFLYDDDQETPNMQSAVFTYDGCQLMFEVRGLITEGDGGLTSNSPNTVGNLFYGSDGYMALDSHGYRIYRGEDRKLERRVDAPSVANGSPKVHMANFLKAVRSRKITDLTADVATGVSSSALCHYANVSYRTAHPLVLDHEGNAARDSKAAALFSRNYRTPYVVPERV
jgi:predicted dehydrogenase